MSARRLTLLAVTDSHGALIDWDYLGDSPTIPFISCRDDRRAIRVAQGPRVRAAAERRATGPSLTNPARPARWPA